jgi:hypothetical protein
VHLKNILLCHPEVIDAPVHPTVVKRLVDTPIETVLVEWLGSMARYSDEIDRLREDGALPIGWVSVDVGPCDAAPRMLWLWDKMRLAAASSPATVSHGDLFRAALPRVYDFYRHVSERVRRESTETSVPPTVVQLLTSAEDAVIEHIYGDRADLSEHDRIMRWM